jgi:hypothetical protein
VEIRTYEARGWGFNSREGLRPCGCRTATGSTDRTQRSAVRARLAPLEKACEREPFCFPGGRENLWISRRGRVNAYPDSAQQLRRSHDRQQRWSPEARVHRREARAADTDPVSRLNVITSFSCVLEGSGVSVSGASQRCACQSFPWQMTRDASRRPMSWLGFV